MSCKERWSTDRGRACHSVVTIRWPKHSFPSLLGLYSSSTQAFSVSPVGIVVISAVAMVVTPANDGLTKRNLMHGTPPRGRPLKRQVVPMWATAASFWCLTPALATKFAAAGFGGLVARVGGVSQWTLSLRAPYFTRTLNSCPAKHGGNSADPMSMLRTGTRAVPWAALLSTTSGSVLGTFIPLLAFLSARCATSIARVPVESSTAETGSMARRTRRDTRRAPP
mmetsp:Transcript_44996/g.102209  ORF Transcript_44996/g.102209 Transcript_44996/m.102209 type:complete len:224 (-) Transcript_44996:23-694(-)